MKFEKGFDQFACTHDRIGFAHGDWHIQAILEPDDDIRPTDYECYSDDDLKRFESGDWCYVAVQVTMTKSIGDSTMILQSWLHGVELNLTSDNRHATDMAEELLANLLDDAKKAGVNV